MSLAESAAVANAEPAQVAGQPQQVWWGVIGQHEARPQTCESKEVAEATRVFYDSHYPALAPHRVLRLIEQPA